VSILVFAYACEPGRGSEPGAGWDWVRLLAGLTDTCVITRANNADVIEQALPETPERDRLSFEYVDLPRWAMFWKRGQRGVRAYYLLWQFAALAAARRLQTRRRFDVIWHLTLANLWLGSVAPLAGRPFVLGPAGGGAATPIGFLPALGARGAAYEVARGAATSAGRYLNPLARLAWQRADLILVQNPESLAWIPRRHRRKAVVFPNALIPSGDAANRPSVDRHPRTMLFAGRLLPFKGVSLAIEALARLAGWRLIVCGKGPDGERLRGLAHRLGVMDRVDFRGWVDREELARIMRDETDVFVFPSLHDQAPLVVAEATAVGVPVVSLDRGGAPLLGAHPVVTRTHARTVAALAKAVEQARNSGPGTFSHREQQRDRLRALLVERGLFEVAPEGRV
jgi:glycosyltransferase involved in cell wall biosynthesis